MDSQVWELRVVGYPSEAMTVGDVDGDRVLDIVITTSAGYVIAVRGDTGAILSGFPIRLPAGVRAPATLLAMECVDHKREMRARGIRTCY